MFNNLASCSVGASGKEPTCQCRRCERCQFNPWIGQIPWERKLQSTPVFLPGESHGQRSLAGYSPWGHKESNMTEATHLASKLRNIWNQDTELSNIVIQIIKFYLLFQQFFISTFSSGMFLSASWIAPY